MSSKIEAFDKTTDERYAARIQLWIQSYNKDHPLWKYTSGFRLIPKFLLHSGSYYLPIKIGNHCFKPYQFLVKVFQSFLYYYMLIFGLVGLIIIALKFQEYLFLGIVISLIFIFCFIMKLIEWRYFFYSFPFLTLGVSYFTTQVLLKSLSGYISTIRNFSKR